MKHAFSRDDKTHERYQAHQKSSDPNTCEFCHLKPDSDQVVAMGSGFMIVKNNFAYDMWDGHDVIDHIMLVPVRHVDTIADFTAQESIEYMELLKQYEANQYSIYARSSTNKSRSIPHQHTHLLCIGDKSLRSMTYDANKMREINF